MRNRKGFTLIELLVVMGIAAILLVSVGMAATTWSTGKTQRAASIVQSVLTYTRDMAAAKAAADAQVLPDLAAVKWPIGLRLVPDPARPLARLADGTIDRSQALTFTRIVPLNAPPPYSNGYGSVDPAGLPQAFLDQLARDGMVSIYRRLILEEAKTGPDGLRAEPTTWWWNVRVGDEIKWGGVGYTVTGPMAISGADNPEGFVNYGLPGKSTSPLDRGAGPVEWLCLTNRRDDDGDGFVDDGWDGLDNDLDGLVDEDDEWEAETWVTPTAFYDSANYRILRRPIATAVGAVELPASVVIDATGWTVAGLTPTRADLRLRSQVPVNLYTGAVDLVFDAAGRCEAPTLYGRPSAGTFGRPWIHLWLADRGDVVAPPSAAGNAAALVSINAMTGRITAGDADPSDAAAAFARAEGGVR